MEGEVEVKTDAGFRVVPVTAGLRRLLIAHRAATGRSGRDLVFGRTAADPFIPSTVRSRALRAWGWKETNNPDSNKPKTIWVKARPDALEPIAPHRGPALGRQLPDRGRTERPRAHRDHRAQ